MKSDLAGVMAGGGTARATVHEDRAAVLLNANAKQVNAAMRDALARVVPAEDLFFSRSVDDANRIADTVVARRYRTVFTGGGDGTFVSWVNRILDRAEHRAVPLPRFGVLALGTGNAVAEVVGARANAPVESLRAWLAGRATGLTRLDLLTCNGRRTPFAGVGIDAAVVNDYNWLKRRFGAGALRAAATGIPGYFLAGALRSAPRCLLERRPAYCEVVNLGAPAHRLDAAGRPVGTPIAHGELLYAGPAMMTAAGTVPFYGFGLKAFPHAAKREGAMQLRLIAEIGVPTVLWNLPRIWSGEFSHPGILDFHAERVSVTFEKPMPLQIGGDAEGWCERVLFGMTGDAVELVDFRPAGGYLN
jgi:diacylglycerol kinase family enzyme